MGISLDPVTPISVWECEGCGRIDHPQPCVGICRDRKAQIVFASDYLKALERIAELETVLRRIVLTTPRGESWEKSYRALQAQAERVL
jgi:hypothetical protein